MDPGFIVLIIIGCVILFFALTALTGPGQHGYGGGGKSFI